MRGIFAALAVVPIAAGCAGSALNPDPAETVTVTQTEVVTAAPPSPPPTSTTTSVVDQFTPTLTPNSAMSYSAFNQVFSVGDTPRGGLTAAIPPGRYAVTIIDGDSGSWMRCSSELCGLPYMENVLAVPFHDIGDTATRHRTGPAVRWGASVVPRR